MKLFSPESRISVGIAALVLAASVLGIFFTLSTQLAAEGHRASHLSMALLLVALAAGAGLLGLALTLNSRCQEKDAELHSLRRGLGQLQAKQVEAQAPAAVQPQGRGEDILRMAQRIMPPDGVGGAEAFAERLLINAAKGFELAQGVMYLQDPQDLAFRFLAGYAYYSQEPPQPFTLGETLPGQAAKSGELLHLDALPEGYMTVVSGLGHASPRHLLVVPIPNPAGECIATLELASFKPFTPNHIDLFRRVGELAGERLTAIANSTPQ